MQDAAYHIGEETDHQGHVVRKHDLDLRIAGVAENHLHHRGQVPQHQRRDQRMPTCNSCVSPPSASKDMPDTIEDNKDRCVPLLISEEPTGSVSSRCFQTVLIRPARLSVSSRARMMRSSVSTTRRLTNPAGSHDGHCAATQTHADEWLVGVRDSSPKQPVAHTQ